MRAAAPARVALAAVFACPAALGGCSALSSVPPPKTAPLVSPVQCSTNRFPPIADVVMAADSGALAVIFWSGVALQYDHNQNETVPSWNAKPLTVGAFWIVGGIVSTAATLAFIASARYGFTSTHDCAVARSELMYRLPPPQWQPGVPFGGAPFPPAEPPPPAPPLQGWPAR